eukprot:GDKH01000617.1.p2 GENE.GDKH01000617.1~~GDKH01000617.1.p2  ORF type:complete len:97 (-),score=12.20 GDKH01000617.1:172-462(-)
MNSARMLACRIGRTVGPRSLTLASQSRFAGSIVTRESGSLATDKGDLHTLKLPLPPVGDPRREWVDPNLDEFAPFIFTALILGVPGYLSLKWHGVV